MLSIELCRKLLGVNGEKLSTEQVEEIRETLYQAGNILVKEYLKRGAKL